MQTPSHESAEGIRQLLVERLDARQDSGDLADGVGVVAYSEDEYVHLSEVQVAADSVPTALPAMACDG